MSQIFPATFKCACGEPFEYVETVAFSETEFEALKKGLAPPYGSGERIAIQRRKCRACKASIPVSVLEWVDQ